VISQVQRRGLVGARRVGDFERVIIQQRVGDGTFDSSRKAIAAVGVDDREAQFIDAMVVDRLSGPYKLILAL